MSEQQPTTPPRRDRLAERAVERQVDRLTEPRGDRLDQPLAQRRRLVPRPRMDPDAFGQFAEGFARFMGTARFLGYMTVFVMIWIAWNFLAPESLRFDPYAFIFLTLMLSLQASYAAPLILLAQNRQADRDKVVIEQDRTRDERNLADTEFLTREVVALRIAMRETATRDFIRSELRSLLDELEDRSVDQSGTDTGQPGTNTGQPGTNTGQPGTDTDQPGTEAPARTAGQAPPAEDE